jgi:hypothetical protein
VDTVAGTDADETIRALAVDPATNAAATTLNATDIIDGGAGVDTLNITNNGTNNVSIVGKVSNVEVVNIDNTGASTVATTATGVLSAAAFTGATLVTQIGGAAATTSGLATTTTAGFKDGAVSGTVSGAATAATATIALDKVSGVNGTATAGLLKDSSKVAAFEVNGAALSAVNLSGTVKTDASGTTGRTSAVDLTIKGGSSALGAALDVSLNSSVATKVTLKTASTSGNVSSFDASASTAAIEFDGNSINSNGTPATAAVASIKTGSGADFVTIATATVLDNVDTSKVETVNASLNAGAGKDTITVNTSGPGSTTVDGGADADTITLTGLSAAASVSGGAGDDTVVASVARFVTGVSVSGGEGTDTLSLSNSSFTTANYLSLEAYTSSFEAVTFTGDDVTVDVSKLRSEVAKITLSEAVGSSATAGATVTGIDGEAIVLGAGAKFALTSLGYDATNASTTGTVYGSSVAATASVDSTTVSANAAAVALTVSTTVGSTASANNVAVTLNGDVKSATVALASTRDVSSAGALLGTENVAKITLDLDANGVSSVVTMNALTSFTVTGAGEVVLDASDGITSANSAPSGKLDLIDLSGMTALVNLDAAGDEYNGSAYAYQNLSTSTITLNADNAETVKLGGGKDTVTTASKLAKMDTIEGYQLTALASDATTVNAAKSDALDVDGITIAAGGVKAITISSNATTLAQALLEAGNAVDATNGNAALDNVVFQFGGDTYFYSDNTGNANADAGYSDNDIVIKFVGALNLGLLAQTIA